MVIPEKVKLVGLTALLGGVGFMVYSSATRSDGLKEAIAHIQSAQVAITESKQIIEVAKNDINSVRGELQKLQVMAGQAKINLEALRQERQHLEKSINQNVLKSREVLKEQHDLVEEFQKLKKEEQTKVNNIPKVITFPFNQKKD
jgi:chromosome segregation ATPase